MNNVKRKVYDIEGLDEAQKDAYWAQIQNSKNRDAIIKNIDYIPERVNFPTKKELKEWKKFQREIFTWTTTRVENLGDDEIAQEQSLRELTDGQIYKNLSEVIQEIYPDEFEEVLQELDIEYRVESEDANPFATKSKKGTKSRSLKGAKSGLRADAALRRLGYPAPVHRAAYNHLSFAQRENLLIQLCTNSWSPASMAANGTDLYDLVSILRGRRCRNDWLSIPAARKVGLAVTSARERILSWALCRNNFHVAPGSTQQQYWDRCLRLIDRLARTVGTVGPTSAGVVCPWCGQVGNFHAGVPINNHYHPELIFIVKMFFMGEYLRSPPEIMWDCLSDDMMQIYMTFSTWMQDWKRAVQTICGGVSSWNMHFLNNQILSPESASRCGGVYFTLELMELLSTFHPRNLPEPPEYREDAVNSDFCWDGLLESNTYYWGVAMDGSGPGGIDNLMPGAPRQSAYRPAGARRYNYTERWPVEHPRRHTFVDLIHNRLREMLGPNPPRARGPPSLVPEGDLVRAAHLTPVQIALGAGGHLYLNRDGWLAFIS
ncbi:hypothetical protein H072_1555 [Dactylellina haptotyla CBS 200.50]|uniref:Uncharacterized protein n=1 Tax=Dactylellina haptotyla (strain CBS 200.50) TaxID=1284197 RepID=S8C9X4_DACHA|nr:hypothetical protein H072_1555 [Dactylellina haptotyla CBS 200.50]